MSATGASGRAFAQYADLMDQALKWRAERDKAMAERDGLRELGAHFARLPVGTRVTHVDPDGKALPMAGTVVAINVRYLVEWDGEEPRPMSGWTPTYYYPADVLRVLP